jgi:hypothetical protein
MLILLLIYSWMHLIKFVLLSMDIKEESERDPFQVDFQR